MCFDLHYVEQVLNALIFIAVCWFAVTAFMAADAERAARRRGERDPFRYPDDKG